MISLLEIGFFESGSAQIKSNSMPAFTRMAGLLAQRKYRIRIEGHTDNVPIHNSRFHSNWELSTERATELIRVLVIRYDFAPERLSAAGYSQYHPVATNDSREGRGLNRRVDVVVLGRESAPHNAARTQSSAPRKLPDDDHGPAMSASDSFRLARFTFERRCMYDALASEACAVWRHRNNGARHWGKMSRAARSTVCLGPARGVVLLQRVVPFGTNS